MKITKENLKHIICTGLMIILAVLFTIAVKTVDKAVVLGKEIGFSKLNMAVHDMFGVIELFDKISTVTMIISFLLLGGLVFIGVYQLLTHKKLKAVDRELIFGGAVFALTVLVYLFFENVIINFRPVLDKGVLEASYPSTHVLLTIVINIVSIDYLVSKIKNKKIMIPAVSIIGVLTVVGVVSRLLSGMHWLTDVAGALLISAALVMLYFTLKGIIFKVAETKEDVGIEEIKEEQEGETNIEVEN